LKVKLKKKEFLMKKAFTMIELIFVIVIIGILAAVAIPKLMATRTDAKASTLANEIQSAVQEISSYVTAHGGDANSTDIDNMSQILKKLEDDGKGAKDSNNTHKFNIYSEGTTTCVSLETNQTGLIVDINQSDDLVCQGVTAILKHDANYTLAGSSVTY